MKNIKEKIKYEHFYIRFSISKFVLGVTAYLLKPIQPNYHNKLLHGLRWQYKLTENLNRKRDKLLKTLLQSRPMASISAIYLPVWILLSSLPYFETRAT